MFRNPKPNEKQLLVELGDATGIFKPSEAQELLGGVLDAFYQQELEIGHVVAVWEEADEPAGWVYYAPSGREEGAFDLWWIGVHPARQGHGLGQAMMQAVEMAVTMAGGTKLVVETSSTELFAKTRRFYTLLGYATTGTESDSYGLGDDKVTFAKNL